MNASTLRCRLKVHQINVLQNGRVYGTSYVNELKKIKTKTNGDADPEYTSSWRLFDIISFLRESVKHR